MDEIKVTVNRLRESLTQHLESDGPSQRMTEVGTLVRELAVKLLKRKDLRITTELLFTDLRNTFTGYETYDHENQRHTLSDGLRIIEGLEMLIAGDTALNSDRLEMPDPPAILGNLKSQIEKIKQEGRDKKERLQKEAHLHRLARRAPRPLTKPVISTETVSIAEPRNDLIFNDKPKYNDSAYRGDKRFRGPREGQRRGPDDGQRRGPADGSSGPKPQPPGPSAPREGSPPGDDRGGPNRQHRRPRRKR